MPAAIEFGERTWPARQTHQYCAQHHCVIYNPRDWFRQGDPEKSKTISAGAAVD